MLVVFRNESPRKYMGKPSRRLRGRRVFWKQFPTLAVAGCTLAGATNLSASSSSSLAILPERPSLDWNASAPWLRAYRRPADLTAPRPYLFQRDFVLGTSFDLVLWTTQPHEASWVELVVLAEIDRLGRILSRYDSQSEISGLNAGSAWTPASPDLIAILRA